MVLLRRLLGDVLRRHRVRQGRTLRDVSAAAKVSLGYLSEIERGRKEASSELLAAICAALDVSLVDVLREVSDDLAAIERPALTPVGFTGYAPTVGLSSSPKLSRAPAVATLRRPTQGAAPVAPSRRPSAPVASLSSVPIAAA